MNILDCTAPRLRTQFSLLIVVIVSKFIRRICPLQGVRKPSIITRSDKPNAICAHTHTDDLICGEAHTAHLPRQNDIRHNSCTSRCQPHLPTVLQLPLRCGLLPAAGARRTLCPSIPTTLEFFKQKREGHRNAQHFSHAQTKFSPTCRAQHLLGAPSRHGRAAAAAAPSCASPPPPSRCT